MAPSLGAYAIRVRTATPPTSGLLPLADECLQFVCGALATVLLGDESL